MTKEGSSRLATFPAGIVGAGLGEVRRRIPSDDPPPLPINGALDVVGKPVPRIDGRAKVTGAARFTVDVRLPGMLFARVLRSPHAHARILGVNMRAAADSLGVRAVHVVTEAGNGVLQTVHYRGAPIAAVAAATRAQAEAALALIKVRYAPLHFVVDLDEARQTYSPAVFEATLASSPGFSRSTNVWGPVRDPFASGSRGNVADGLAEADFIIDGQFRTQVQTHCCLEPHAIVADWQPNRLTVYTSTQNVRGVRDELAETFGLEQRAVRVISEFMGGGFGSKLSAGDYAFLAVELSRKAGAPVSLVYDRHEEQISGGNRPGTAQLVRMGAKRDGTVTAITVLAFGTAGTEMGAGVGNFAQSLYSCPNFEMVQYDVLTNAGPGCAMRAPGNVQGAFAVEQMIDELAERLEFDPLALRDRIDPSLVRREQRRIGGDRIGWNSRHPAGAEVGTIKCGLGVAQSFWPGIVDTSSSCEVQIERDGSVVLRSGVQDLGTGTRTVLAQVVAEECGLRAEDITVLIGDSDFPAGQSSGGSKMTGSITPAARNAAHKAMRALAAVIAPKLDATVDDLVTKNGRIFVRGTKERAMSFRDAAAFLSEPIRTISGRPADYGGYRLTREAGGLAQADIGGVQFASVEVDTETGIVRVKRVVAVHDCGRPINPLQVESQIHGGIIMGLGFALFEERTLDRGTGSMLNADLEQYKIPGIADVPEIDVVLLENYHAQSSTDACGVAEPATIPTAAAIANAVYNAIGFRVRSLPMKPATILATLGKIPSLDWSL